MNAYECVCDKFGTVFNSQRGSEMQPMSKYLFLKVVQQSK